MADATGWLTVRDVLAVGEWHACVATAGRPRPPSDEAAEHVLVRVARCTTGRADVWCACEPVFDYGATDPGWQIDSASPGGGSARAAHGEDDGTHVHLRTSMAIGVQGRGIIGRRRLEANQELFVAISWPDGRAPETLDDAHRLLDVSGDYWREWLGRGEFPDHPWSSVLQRSALTLKGLIYRPTGAILAAATTSLPETPTTGRDGAESGKRNWDYRYTWVRDSAFTLWSLKSLGFREADDYLGFLLDVGTRAATQPVYAIDGVAELHEGTVALRGYENASPVRIGNAAYAQQQNDVWEAIVDAAYLDSDKAATELSEDLWRLVQAQVSSAVDNWQRPDRGIWEVRGEPQHFTSSKASSAGIAPSKPTTAWAQPRPRSASAPSGSRRRTPRSVSTSWPARCARSCCRTPALRRGARTEHRTPLGELPSGVHTPGTHQRGSQDHRLRAWRAWGRRAVQDRELCGCTATGRVIAFRPRRLRAGRAQRARRARRRLLQRPA